MNDSTVLILMTTYNGAAYLKAQLDSLLAQDYANIRIVVSDDGSTDATPSILQSYAEAHPDKVSFYRSGHKFGCAQQHFMHLLAQFHDAPYIMFCDQDDVWHADKVSKTLQYMQSLNSDPGVPALVHTDLRVVNSDLSLVSPSFWKHSALDGSRLALNQLLVQNVVTGCTMMINGALAELACRHEMNDAILMHDWYLAILASVTGVSGALNEATIDYRQHTKNSVGAKNVYSPAYLTKRLRSKKMRNAFTDATIQAEYFYNCYEELLSDQDREVLLAFISTKNASLWRRNRICIKYRLLKYGTVRILAQLLGC